MRYSFRTGTVNKLGTEAKDLDTMKATDSKAPVFIIPNALTPGAPYGVSLTISVHRVDQLGEDKEQVAPRSRRI